MSSETFTDQVAIFTIGGMPYSLLIRDIQAHKDCYFASVIKDVWNNSDQPIVIDRDGLLFQHIFVYMYTCRHRLPFVLLKGSLQELVGIRREADYYNLPELVALCDQAYEGELQKWCMTQPLTTMCDCYKVALNSEKDSELEALVNSEVYPACQSGTIGETDISSRVFTVLAAVEVLLRSHLVISDNEHFASKGLYQVQQALDWSSLKELGNTLPTLPGDQRFHCNEQVFAVAKGGHMRTTPQSNRSAKCLGRILCILNSPYTGGTITVTRNGVKESISQPRQYLVFSSDHTVTIDTVTSGLLVFASFDLADEMQYRREYWIKETMSFGPLPTQDALVCAVEKELSHISSTGSVVLCLSTLYPIVEFDPTAPYLETDPDILTDRDAMLYEYLNDIFEVTLVTVYVQRHAYDCIGCIIGTTPENCNTTAQNIVTGEKIKIIAPFHGLRELFPVSNKHANNREEFATLYTALHITKRANELLDLC